MVDPLKARYNEPKIGSVQSLFTDEHSMISASLQFPIFGPEIQCPHCRQSLPALTLTDTYLCHRHGAFEANPDTKELVHLQSGRHWRRWEGEWYRQHTHPDGIRFEIHEALDRLYTEGYRVTRVIIAQRYYDLINTYLERATPWIQNGEATGFPRLYGLQVEFSPDPKDDPRWYVINFAFEKEMGSPSHLPYSRFMD
jgi:uncharacterized protein (TIGR02652 family)